MTDPQFYNDADPNPFLTVSINITMILFWVDTKPIIMSKDCLDYPYCCYKVLI